MPGELGVPGGPLYSLKYGGLTLHPKEDASPEWDFGGRDYEFKRTGDGEPYSEAGAIPGTLVVDIVINAQDYKTLYAMKDGQPRAGTGTDANGNVYTLNMGIAGECKMSNGIVSLNLSGMVRLQ